MTDATQTKSDTPELKRGQRVKFRVRREVKIGEIISLPIPGKKFPPLYIVRELPDGNGVGKTYEVEPSQLVD